MDFNLLRMTCPRQHRLENQMRNRRLSQPDSTPTHSREMAFHAHTTPGQLTDTRCPDSRLLRNEVPRQENNHALIHINRPKTAE
jgi:hypothetical protein